MDKPPFYLTTPIYYVNDLPHIGHIYTTVVADTVARYKRMRGYDVYFLTGTDEHGQKIDRSARDQGTTPKALADRVVGRYHELWQVLGITNDDFIRTTQARHHQGVHTVIARMRDRGDIYKDGYEGWYCAGCEAFYPETQLVDGRCPDQGHAVELLREESYFFRLSAYQERLLEHYRKYPEFIRPESRYNEVMRFVESGLRDLSISRVSLRWGIPFPNDEAHVVYVWLDALTNYISALGFGSADDALYAKYWPASLHLMGKDILRFHCVYWPAFLMSAGLPLPQQVFGHGWWLRDDKKMSKSLGNVVRPDYLIRAFGADALRYFLLREMTFGSDATFSDEGFLQRYNADLANGLGNTASRLLAMSRRYYGGCTPGEACGESVVRDRAEDVIGRYLACMDRYEFHRALEAVWELLATVDGYVNEKAPWAVAKQEGSESPRLARILYVGLEALRLAAVMLMPVMPAISRQLLDQLGLGEVGPAGVELQWGGLPTSRQLGNGEALFPRADIEAFFAEVNVSDETRVEQPAIAPETGEPNATLASATEPVVAELGIEEFFRTKLVVGTVRVAERVPKSNKLVRMEVELGEPTLRQIVAGIGKAYQPDDLVGRQIVVVANLKSALLMGVESQGMVLAASEDGVPVLLAVDREVPPGTVVR